MNYSFMEDLDQFHALFFGRETSGSLHERGDSFAMVGNGNPCHLLTIGCTRTVKGGHVTVTRDILSRMSTTHNHIS
jgi:hypothetical protein